MNFFFKNDKNLVSNLSKNRKNLRFQQLVFFSILFFTTLTMVLGFHIHHHHQDGQNQPPPVPPPIMYTPPSTSNLSGNPSNNQPGYKSVLYFCNWAIYARKHFPKDVPVDQVSHLLYAFANVVPESGEVVLSDKWSDTDIVLDEDSWNDPQNYLKGCFNQFYKLKQKHRHFKILLSIGGWTYSSNVASGASTPERRKKFATSALQLLKDLGLDGLDIDWEYPSNEDEAQNYVDLLREIRLELDSYALHIGLPRDQFALSIAAPAGPENYRKLKIKDMDPYLSFWNIMCYDYAGSWSQTAQYHSNLFNGELSTDATIRYYESQGVPSTKLVMGMPIYGRAFANTEGLGKSFSGVGQGTWEAGTYDYKALPLPDSQETVDMESVAVSCYDAKNKVLVTYENNKTAEAKADYICKNRLGGGMWWESSADFAVTDPRSILGSFTKVMGRQYMDQTPNCLEYPESSHDNIKGSR